MVKQRYTPHVEVRRDSPNHGLRYGVIPSLIVVHSTESDNRTGNGDLASVADYLCRPPVEASTHVIVDADGHSARVVVDELKAWHVGGFNPVSLGIEQVGRAAQSFWTRNELREAARWIARWHKKYGIPLRHGAVDGKVVTRSGVIRHSELGAYGGGHHDPGDGYPLASVIGLAGFYAAHL